MLPFQGQKQMKSSWIQRGTDSNDKGMLACLMSAPQKLLCLVPPKKMGSEGKGHLQRRPLVVKNPLQRNEPLNVVVVGGPGLGQSLRLPEPARARTFATCAELPGARLQSREPRMPIRLPRMNDGGWKSIMHIAISPQG